MKTLDSTPMKSEKALGETHVDEIRFDLEGKSIGSSFPTPPGSPTKLNRTERIGETLHILRPLIHRILCNSLRMIVVIDANAVTYLLPILTFLDLMLPKSSALDFSVISRSCHGWRR